MTDYVYVIGEGKILFGRRIGAREKELLTVPLRNIRKMDVYPAMEKELAGRKNINIPFVKEGRLCR